MEISARKRAVSDRNLRLALRQIPGSRRGAARAGRDLRRATPTAAAALGRNAPTGGDLPGAHSRTEAVADGRAVFCPRRDHAGRAQRDAARYLGAPSPDRVLCDPLDS